MNKKILFLVLLGALILPQIISAQTGITIASMLESIILNVVKPVAIFAVITLWVATGIIFLTAQGDPGKLNLGKTALIAAIVGTIIVVLAPIAADIIGNSLGIW